MDNDFDGDLIPGLKMLAMVVAWWGKQLPLNEELSSSVIHIKFCSAPSGSSMTVLPKFEARPFNPFKNQVSSSPDKSMNVAWGLTKSLICLYAAALLTSMRKSEL